MLEFVTLTGEQSKSERQATSKKVRQQAMRHYIEQQHRQTLISTNKKAVEPGPLIEDPVLYQGKFKLRTWTHKSRGRSYASQKSGKTKFDQPSDASASESKPKEIKCVDNYNYLSIKHLDSGYQLDPFDSLSIQLSPQSIRLLRYYHNSYSMNSVAINPVGDFFSTVRDDPAVLHSILYLVALHSDLRYGVSESLSSLYHRGEAFKVINQRLRMEEGTQNDSTIIAVAMLVNRENINGNYDLAKIHMKGLSQMLQEGNGIQVLQPVFQRIVTWSDFCFASVWNCAPSLPLLSSNTALSKRMFTLSLDINFPGYLSLSNTLPTDSPIINIFRMLRILSNSLSPCNIASTNLLEASSMIYHTEYEILLLNKPDSALYYSLMESHSEALKIAAQLYLWLVIRQLPPKSELLFLLVQRLRDSLSFATLDWWSDNPERAVWLLWILSIGLVVAGPRPERWWFVSQLKNSCHGVGIESVKSLGQALKKILWGEDWFKGHCDAVWSDMECLSIMVHENL